MTTPAQEQMLQQELQNELTVSNQLLRLITLELQKIKALTGPGGDLEINIIQNAALIENLAKNHKINIDNLPAMKRIQIDNSNS